MPFLITLIGLLVTIAVWSWRMRIARQGAKEALDLAKTAANLPRRMSFRYKAAKNGLDLIEDPREAAAIMLVEMARARGGPLTERQTTQIESEIRQTFQFSEKDAGDLAAHAIWVTNSAPPPTESMRRLSQMIIASTALGPKEIVDLDSMLVAVSEAEGAPTRDQMALLQVFRDKAGLKT